MRATQNIFRVRRRYNTWVGNQTLEDYALRFTATRARRWSIDQVAKTALGATAFMALEAIAAAVTLRFGFANTMWAMLTVSAVIFLTGFPISYYAAKYGLDIDLLTRNAGFGYLGSTITSLIYASFTFIFFAIEAAILASALQALLGIPLAVGYVICALAVIPVVTHGISAISKFQMGTQNFWLLLQLVALALVAIIEVRSIPDWTAYTPASVPEGSTFDLALFGGAAAVMFAMIAQIGEQVDYLRFMPVKTRENRKRWWFWLILAGPGWILIGIVKMLLGSFLAYLAVTRGLSYELATDPTHMYQMAFNHLVQSPAVALMLAATMVIISQMKINVTNAYAGSIAWSNFFSRLTHSHPGRVVWLVFNVAIALALMELGIYRALESILGIFAIVAVSWLGALSADLLINKPLGLSPASGEFKRGHLYDVNPVGVGTVLIASAVGILCYLGQAGSVAQSLAHFATLGLCYLLVPIIAYVTRGKFYLARQPSDLTLLNVTQTADSTQQVKCCICENPFELPDVTACPAYQGPICSLCCSLDARCMDACKPHARFTDQAFDLFRKILPERLVTQVDPRVARFLGIFGTITLLTGALLSLIYYQMAPADTVQAALLQRTVWTLFFTLMIVFGVISWLFLLARESREVAQLESNRQTRRLIEEIEAHQITDQYLQEAKEHAERANQAKSRYLGGISHELRTPLQAIMGYAQLLSDRENTPDLQKGLRIIRRNSEYLNDLIEGLLDISKIEAGRLELYRNHVKLPELLDQLTEQFSRIAEAKGLQFVQRRSGSLPQSVVADEKRLRQILTNLLSNAVKYTENGSVELDIRYRNQVAEFCVTDTGVGIDASDMQRILDPFERVRNPRVPNVSGTGLGLTIVRLLTDIMGGELTVESEPEKGSTFRVSLMLSRVETSEKSETSRSRVRQICGYAGEPICLMVVDDDPVHRGLMSDLLQPFGFQLLEAQSAEDCLAKLTGHSPHLFLLDFSMPGMDGMQLAHLLRERNIDVPIIMLSADAEERHRQVGSKQPHDAYLVKPVSNAVLLELLGSVLQLQWNYNEPEATTAAAQQQAPEIVPGYDGGNAPPEHQLLRELNSFARSGFARGVRATLQQIAAANLMESAQLRRIEVLAEEFRYTQIVQLLDDGVC